MIPVYLIYDNKGNRYGAYCSLKEAIVAKVRIENNLREKDELKDIELEITYSR